MRRLEITTPRVYGAVRHLAEGKISCECGNLDWRQFLYVCNDDLAATAGCKHCGTVQALVDGEWKVIARMGS